MENVVNISVRTLVEHVFQSGSIDARFRSQSTMVDGTRIHQRIQKTYGEGDQKEVYLQMKIPYEELTFVIDGRADGLLLRDDEVIIDEIKSFRQQLVGVDEDGSPVHWAQANLYAYIYASQHELEKITVQLTYVQVDTEEKRYMKKKYSLLELETFVEEVIQAYAPYARLLHGNRLRRDESIKGLEFPFANYREGQRKLAGAVYKSVLDKRSLFVKAPTGIGKTISTIFPSVKAINEGHLNRIFYLTAKTITRATAEEAFERMRKCGLKMNTLTITAKDKICFKK